MRALTLPMNRSNPPVPEVQTPHDAAATARAEVAVIRRVSSAEQLGDADRLIIEHQGRDYMLRRTANGKLILTA
jgi:hemin uptake protein HemP